MPFDPDAYLAKPKPNSAGFDPDAYLQKTEGKSLSGFAKNAVQDVKDTGIGLGNLAVNLAKHPIDTTVNMATKLPGAVIDEGKRIGIGELLTGHPINAVEKFGGALYDKPLTTILDVLPAAGAAGKALGIGKKAATVGTLAEEAASLADDAVRAGGSLADDAARVARTGGGVMDDVARMGPAGAPPPLNLGDEASQILKETPQAAAGTIPTGATFAETVQNIGKKVPASVKEPLGEITSYLESKYGKAANKPGLIQNLGKTLEQKARGMRIKEVGGTPGQVRMLKDRFGDQVVNDLADLADKKGIGKGFYDWQTGDNIKRLRESSGQQIGAIRDVATKRGAVHDMDSFVQRIRAELDPIYLKGSRSSQKGAYMKAVQDIANTAPDVNSISGKISDVNRFIKKNKMVQPLSAASDVMNVANRLNNELIGRFLNPQETALYREALKDYSAAKVFDKMYGFTYGREMAGRSGPSSIWNTVKDIGGRKLMEKVFTKMGRGMQRTPERYRNPMNLSHDVLDAVNDSLDEVIEQMGEQAH